MSEEMEVSPEGASEKAPGEDQDKVKSPKKGRGFRRGFVSGVVVCLIALFIAGLILASRDGIYGIGTLSKLRFISSFIHNYYYEEVDSDDLKEGLYAGLFDNLDEYSEYYTAEEYKDLYESTLSGTYCGIGAVLQANESAGGAEIIRVYEDSPAQEAGLSEGDIIVEAEGYAAAGMELSDFVSHIKGDEGTSVHLLVYRDGEELEFDVTRANLTIPTVTSELFGETGYIEVSEFSEYTPDQFSKALDELTDQGAESLIIDLRYNTGGLLNAACTMLDDILPEGLLVYTEDRAGNRVEYTSSDEKTVDLPVAVLVNGYSASASEIFAGAIQDRGAGTIVGTLTYGKGVVQTIHVLSDGSAIKLTTSRYFTPGGTCIDGIGITPDVEIEYEFLGGEDDEYDYTLDNQIQKALEILNAE